jgi:hypothetical protein
MNKRVVEIGIETKGSEIWITQPRMGDDDVTITISPDQVDILVTWLNEAKTELLGGKKAKPERPLIRKA